MLNHVITDDSLAVFKLVKAEIVSVRDVIVRAVRIQNTIVERFSRAPNGIIVALLAKNDFSPDITS